MKKRLTLIAFAGALMFGPGCDLMKHDTTAYFWTKEQHDEKQYLFIDGNNSGRVPPIEDIKDDEKEKIYKDALLVSLSTGKYELEIKNDQGKVLSSGMLEMKKTVNSTTTTVSWNKDSDCKVEVVYK